MKVMIVKKAKTPLCVLSVVTRLKRDYVVEILRLVGCENSCENINLREIFIFDTFLRP